MSKKQIETMLPKALQQAAKLANDNGEIESKYFAYAASFGVSILQSGAPAVALFYSSGPRQKILSAVKAISGLDTPRTKDKEKLLDAATALKLAMRTYTKIPNRTDEAREADNE